MGFSRQEHCSGLSFPSPGALPDPGIEPRCPALVGGFSTTKPPGKPLSNLLDPRTFFMKRQAKMITAQNILRAGVPKLRDLIPNDLRQGWSNNHRNEVHNKCNGLESPWNHPPQPPVCGRNCLPWNPSLVPKRLGTADERNDGHNKKYMFGPYPQFLTQSSQNPWNFFKDK